jgi:hypothetical protein
MSGRLSTNEPGATAPIASDVTRAASGGSTRFATSTSFIENGRFDGRHERVRRNRTPALALGHSPSRPRTRGRHLGSTSCGARP